VDQGQLRGEKAKGNRKLGGTCDQGGAVPGFSAQQRPKNVDVIGFGHRGVKAKEVAGGTSPLLLVSW